jgi:hypothetical protein
MANTRFTRGGGSVSIIDRSYIGGVERGERNLSFKSYAQLRKRSAAI